MLTPYKRGTHTKIHTHNRCSFKTTSIASIDDHLKHHKLKYPHDLFSCTKFANLEPYSCNICKYESDFVVDLKKHAREIHTLVVDSQTSLEKIKKLLQFYRCKKCNFKTYSRLVLLKHAKIRCLIKKKAISASTNSQFSCEHCLYKSESIFFMNMHVTAEHNSKSEKVESALETEQSLNCSRCPYKTESSLFMKMHLTAEHKMNSLNSDHFLPPPTTSQDSKQLKCDAEDKLIPEEHSASKHNGTWFRCNYCLYQCREIDDLRKHSIETHTTIDGSKRLSCGQCSFKTRWKSSLEIHTRVRHTPDEEARWFKCDHCPYKSKDRGCLRRHMRVRCSLSDNMKQHRCDKCPYKTFLEVSFKAHVARHHQPTWFSCEECSYRSKWRSGLRMHKIRHHKKYVKMTELERRSFKRRLKMFQCEHCSYLTKYRLYFNNHMNKKHLQPQPDKQFRCDYCEYTAKKRVNLRNHIAAKHTTIEDLKCFECEECSFTSPWKCEMQKHIFMKHVALSDINIQG